jgi:head-tail adaptor
MTAGAKTYLMAFDRRVAASDGAGNELGGWAEQFRAWVAIRFLRGGEAVQAARLEGEQPAILTVWASAQTKLVGHAWRAREVVSGRSWNVKSAALTDSRSEIEMVAMAGVADG